MNDDGSYPNFDQWCLSAKSKIELDGYPLPLLTEVLVAFCRNDPKKFERMVEILSAAFKAGGEHERWS
jgi:hypothetical protein